MKHSRKFLSLVLVLSLLISLIALPTFADDATYTYKYKGGSSNIQDGDGDTALFRLEAIAQSSVKINAYCVDPDVGIEKTDYAVAALGNADRERKLRAIVLGGYPNVAREAFQSLAGTGYYSGFWIFQTWHSAPPTEKEALSGTQAAIWKAYNDANTSGLSDNAKKIRDYLLGLAGVNAPATTGTLAINNGVMTETPTQFNYSFSIAVTGAHASAATPSLSGVTGASGATISGSGNAWKVTIPKSSVTGPFQFTINATGSQRIFDVFLMNGKKVSQKLVSAKPGLDVVLPLAAVSATVSVGTVTTLHVDTANATLAASTLKYGIAGTAYATGSTTVTDYTWNGIVPANSLGSFTSGNTDVTYVYEKNFGADVTVKHMAGSTVLATETITPKGRLGELFTASAKTIPMYRLVSGQTETRSGTFTHEPQTITFQYERIPAASLTVKHVVVGGEKDGTVLTMDSYGIGKFVGDTETVAPRTTFTGYASTDTAQTVTYAETEQTVTFQYTALPGGTVTVYHARMVGSEPASFPGTTKTLSGDFDEVVSTEGFTTITGYDQDAVMGPGTFDGTTDTITITLDAQTVTYLYAPVDGGDVTVQYVVEDSSEEENGKLLEEIILSGKFDAPFTTEQKDFTSQGYSFDLSTSPTSGTFTMSGQSVTYTYHVDRATVLVQHVFEEEVLAADKLTGRASTGYTAQPRTDLYGYAWNKETPENATGVYGSVETVMFQYVRVTGQPVVTKYVDADGLPIDKEDSQTGLIGDPYSTSAKNISGYSLELEPENKTGVFSDQAQTVIYTYSKNPVIPNNPIVPATVNVTLNLTVVGPGSVNPGSDAYSQNSVIVFSVVPQDGATFQGWSGPDGTLVSNDNQLVMSEDRTLTATFIALEDMNDEATPEGTPEDTATVDKPALEPVAETTPAAIELPDDSAATEEIVLEENVPLDAPELPKTGGLPLFLLSGMGALLTTGGLLARKRNKDNK